jgi:hypothetical protein
MSIELESRVESALARVMRDAFPEVQITSWSEPDNRESRHIGIKVESTGEEVPGTEIHLCDITIEAANLTGDERNLMRRMFANAHTAKETILLESKGAYVMPQGQPVEVMGAPRTAEDQNRRVITYELQASIQPTFITAPS